MQDRDIVPVVSELPPEVIEAGVDAFLCHWIGVKEGFEEDLRQALADAFVAMRRALS